MKIKHITIVHGLPDTNSGGSALGMSLIQVLKDNFPGVKISYVSSHRNKNNMTKALPFIRSRYPDIDILPFPLPSRSDNFRIKSRTLRIVYNLFWGIGVSFASLLLICPLFARNETFKRIRESSIVISRGTNIFYDRSGRFSAREFISKFWLTFPLLFAWRIGCPFVVYAQSIGPVHNWVNFNLIRFCLNKARYILPREELSAAYLTGVMGINKSSIQIVPDSVFAYRIPLKSHLMDYCQRLSLPWKNYIVVVLRESMTRKKSVRDLFPEILESLRYLKESGMIERCVIVTQCHHFSEYKGFESDSKISREIFDYLQSLGGDFITLIDKALTPDELIAIYGGARYLVSMRLHAAIFAMLAGTPVIPISYWGFKTNGIMQSLGLQRLVLEQGEITAQKLKDRLAYLEKNYDEINKEIERSVVKARGSALETPRIFSSLLS